MIKRNHKFSRAPHLEILSEEQVYAIHSATLEILERIGMECNNKKALKIFKNGGAYVEGDRVRIPPAMVEKVLRTAPSRSLITGRHGNGKVLLEKNVSNYGCGTDVPYHIDPYSHEIRFTTLKDITNISKVINKCDNIDFTSNSGLASDVQPELQDLYHYRTGVTHCDKPFFTTAASGENTKALIDMAAVFSGSHRKLSSAPSLIVYAEPVSPLYFDECAVDVLLVCSENRIPIVFPPMVQLGATGPMAVADGIAQGSAESLAGLVLHQIKSPGSPFIWGPFVGMLDMRTTNCIYGWPVLMKSQTALGQISRFYGIPTFGFASVTDSAMIDAQCGMEMTWSVLTNALAGLNLCHDVGYLNSGMIVSLESLLLADEIISAVKHYMEGIEVNEETLAVDVLERVGPGGNFLTEEHSIKYMKKEGWYPRFLNRDGFQAWKSGGSKTVNQRLEEKAHQIIEEDVPSLISEDEMKELDKIIAEREKKFA
jgi:trimethylamine--corrinoid protein Co-methyltransferase